MLQLGDRNMECPRCKKEMKLIRDYETWENKTGLLWYCFNCNGIMRTLPNNIESIELR